MPSDLATTTFCLIRRGKVSIRSAHDAAIGNVTRHRHKEWISSPIEYTIAPPIMTKITQTNRSICFLNSDNACDAFFDRPAKMVRNRSMSGTSAAKMTKSLYIAEHFLILVRRSADCTSICRNAHRIFWFRSDLQTV